MTEHIHTEKCRTCNGTGLKPPKPEWSEDDGPKPKGEPTQNNITTPKNERPQGTRELRLLFERCGDALHDDLGYTKDTPLYYIAHAVFTDWLNSRGA